MATWKCSIGVRDLLENEYFQAIQENNRIMLRKLHKKVDQLGMLVYQNELKSLNSDTDYRTIVSSLGFTEIEEFNKLFFRQQQNYLYLTNTFGELDYSGAVYRTAVSLYIRDNPFNTTSDNSNPNGFMLACTSECIIEGVHCDDNADTGYAIGSANCSSLILVPAAWALCQAINAVVYTNEIIACLERFEECCPG